jgi:hypothetical protein
LVAQLLTLFDTAIMSSAIGRFTTALLAGSQENTFALAHVNFDFSLYKVEAPPEFQALGSCLTEERRNIAEKGSQHIVARKLGALFRSKLPPVPNLIRAYGKRVSEISKVPKDPHIIQDHGLFSRQAGIDGTIIWAAATSGPGAIEVQLLACILARFWTGPEAVSIWEEVVEARKIELGSRSEAFDFPEVVAMQANLTREQFADWDAGARAWLKTADAVKLKHQTQQRLIFNNFSVSVNEQTTTYENVMETWITAMSVVDKLLSGVPQGVHDGAALVGLTSWHLYPEMQIYENEFKEVKFTDELVPQSGLLTIGLRSRPDIDEGIRWSLPLAKLRYYGDPVVSTKRLDSRSSREPFENIMFVALGCLSKVWPDDDHERYHSLCTYYSLLWGAFEHHNAATSAWMSEIAEASRKFLDSSREERRSFKKLLDFGRRRCENFLTNQGKPISLHSQLLGMEDPDVYLYRLQSSKKRIEHLRRVAANAAGKDGNPRDWIIVVIKEGKHNLATALPSNGPTGSRRFRKCHCQWNPNSGQEPGWTGKVSDPAIREDDLVLRLRGWRIQFAESQMSLERSNKSKKCQVLTISKKGTDLNYMHDFEHRYVLTGQGEKVRTGEDVSVIFESVWGDPNLAALYFRRVEFGPRKKVPNKLPERVSLGDIMKCLGDGPIRLTEPELSGRTTDTHAPLQALGVASKVYKSLGTACSMRVTDFELGSSKWFSGLRQQITRGSIPPFALPKISMSSAFACIVFFDTGEEDLDPAELKHVMAVSVDDSIYVSATLTSDPYENPETHTVYRTLGNVGKPGVSLLIPPADPKMRKVKTEEWRMVNHDDYNYQPENSFKETSLHLWLTEYRVPYHTDHRGARNLQAFFQEAVISVHDRSEWVGDLDIIKALCSSQDMVRRIPSVCVEEKRMGNPDRRATSIDNFYELFDQPEGLAVVRAHGNWLGRLAAAVLSVQQGLPIVILQGESRAQCAHKNRCVLANIGMHEKLVIY